MDVELDNGQVLTNLDLSRVRHTQNDTIGFTSTMSSVKSEYVRWPRDDVMRLRCRPEHAKLDIELWSRVSSDLDATDDSVPIAWGRLNLIDLLSADKKHHNTESESSPKRNSPRRRRRRGVSPTRHKAAGEEDHFDQKCRGRPIWIDLKDKRGTNDQGRLLIFVEMCPISLSSSSLLGRVLEEPGEGTISIKTKSVRSFEKIDAVLEMSTPKGLESITRRLRLGVVGPGETDMRGQSKLKLPVESALGNDGILSPALRLVLRETGSNRKIGSASVSLREFLISKKRRDVWVSIREDDEEDDDDDDTGMSEEIAAVRFEMTYCDERYRHDLRRDDDDVVLARYEDDSMGTRRRRRRRDEFDDDNISSQERLQLALNMLRSHVHDIRLCLLAESDDGVHATQRQVCIGTLALMLDCFDSLLSLSLSLFLSHTHTHTRSSRHKNNNNNNNQQRYEQYFVM